ncbi:DUF6745 domain-containing protein [Actinomadura macrotermitis]|uniref:DUF6745 domain-containing protein n=1 Tax=Actinomadura macrotermitis TaxID=2585200 RepID=A0A7K0BX87_9ACTN|nr:hypothetical protein [Actinomadura macrotermitis]MQY05803.1 hypothetical protein [Actinomadura macrotermitis]
MTRSRDGREAQTRALRQALQIRDEWLAVGLSTRPADRPAAEAAITGLYRLAGHDPPGFVWVDSPFAARAVLPDTPPLRSRDLRSSADDPVYLKLAPLAFQLREGLTPALPGPQWWRWDRAERDLITDDPVEAVRAGVPLDIVLRSAVDDVLRDLMEESFRAPLRAELGETPGFAWYGQHDASWLAYLDVRHRLGLNEHTPEEDHRFGLWTAIARSCGWWWPQDDVCVISERPTAVHTEETPTRSGGLRLHSPDGPAVRFADGWSVHAWHGTRVPGWVVTEPDVERIAAENNIEVRRCAIERIGWDVYIDRAGLDLVATAPDPGNPGCELRLYDLRRSPGIWGPRDRVLLAVNGSVERDGTRRRYGLGVPGYFNDPIEAAGWSYGLTGAQYSQLLRRT